MIYQAMGNLDNEYGGEIFVRNFRSRFAGIRTDGAAPKFARCSSTYGSSPSYRYP